MYCAELSKQTSYVYNQISGKWVGNCENKVWAQSVKDWWLTTFKCILDTYAIPIGEGRTEVVWGDLPTKWKKEYNWSRLGLKEAMGALEVSPLSADEHLASSGD